jgi:pilus assembly protein Flp/PilA
MEMYQLIKKFYNDESGATMVEYAIMVALIAVAVAATVILVGNEMNTMFSQVQACLASPSPENCTLAAAAPAP